MPEELLEGSLVGTFVPFRSPRLSDLPHRSEAFAFARELWGPILEELRPQLVVCIDGATFQHLGSMLFPGASELTTMLTGWGRCRAELRVDGQIRLLRLPHLSTFQLFSRRDCECPVREILRLALGQA